MRIKTICLFPVAMVLNLCIFSTFSYAENIVYDEVYFAPVVLSNHEGKTFLDVEDEASRSYYSYPLRDYDAFKKILTDAISKKM